MVTADRCQKGVNQDGSGLGQSTLMGRRDIGVHSGLSSGLSACRGCNLHPSKLMQY
jgi:hypothetical protein